MQAGKASVSMVPRASYLIVTRAGKNSLHTRWMEPTGVRMDYDILVGVYEEDAPRANHEQVFYAAVPGRKVDGIGRMLRDYDDLIGRYDCVAFLDDDISADPETLSRCFRIGSGLGLKIWQPALTPDSHYTYAGLVENRRYKLRYVNFIEMMCPFFAGEKLREIAFLYRSGYESGIDLVWCNVGAEDKKSSFAVLDCCPVRHTRPVGQAKEKNGFTGGRRYESDIDRALDEFGIPWLGCVPYAGLTSKGALITSRAAMFVDSVPLLASVPKNAGRRLRLRAVLVHWKHLLTGTAGNYVIDCAERAGAWPAARCAPRAAPAEAER